MLSYRGFGMLRCPWLEDMARPVLHAITLRGVSSAKMPQLQPGRKLAGIRRWHLERMDSRTESQVCIYTASCPPSSFHSSHQQASRSASKPSKELSRKQLPNPQDHPKARHYALRHQVSRPRGCVLLHHSRCRELPFHSQPLLIPRTTPSQFLTPQISRIHPPLKPNSQTRTRFPPPLNPATAPDTVIVEHPRRWQNSTSAKATTNPAKSSA